MPEDEDEYISVEEVAQVLNVSVRSTQRYTQNDRVRSRRVGNRLQFHQADVLALADGFGFVNKRPAPPQSVPADVQLGYIEKLRVETNTLNTQIGQLQEQLRSTYTRSSQGPCECLLRRAHHHAWNAQRAVCLSGGGLSTMFAACAVPLC